MKIIQSNDTPISDIYLENQGLLSFTSLISGEHNYVFLKEHLKRVLKGQEEVFKRETSLELVEALKKELVNHWSKKSYFRIVILEDRVLFFKKDHKFHEQDLNVELVEFEKENSYSESVKNGNYQESFQLKELALSNGYDDVIFYDHNNHLTEASTSNIFLVMEDSKVLTPPVSSQVLNGVLRLKVIEFLKNEKIEVQEVEIHKDLFFKAREVWLTNAIEGIRRVKKINKNELSQECSLYKKITTTMGRFGEKKSGEEDFNSQVSRV